MLMSAFRYGTAVPHLKLLINNKLTLFHLIAHYLISKIEWLSEMDLKTSKFRNKTQMARTGHYCVAPLMSLNMKLKQSCIISVTMLVLFW